VRNLRTRVTTVGTTALVAGLVLSCAAPAISSTDIPAMRSAVVANYPRVDGSTTTGPLARLLACDLLGVPCVWSAPASANIERTYVPDPDASVSSETAARITGIKFSTTHNAYVNLIEGRTDVLLEARLPSPDELTEAAAKGVELQTNAFALDAFVFLVNVGNPTDSLPLANLRDVYAGKIGTWSAAGGDLIDPAARINAYQREPNSGSQELMKQLVMGATPMIDAPEMIVKTMAGPYNAIGGDPVTGNGGDRLGLGYSVYYYAAVMFSNPQVKMIGVDDVKPTSATISSRVYPLAAEVYLVTRKDAAAGSPALNYRDWLLSPDGQRVVGTSGYVPVSSPGQQATQAPSV
jgi:phosphate transport system substrate-binding protein